MTGRHGNSSCNPKVRHSHRSQHEAELDNEKLLSFFRFQAIFFGRIHFRLSVPGAEPMMSAYNGTYCTILGRPLENIILSMHHI